MVAAASCAGPCAVHADINPATSTSVPATSRTGAPLFSNTFGKTGVTGPVLQPEVLRRSAGEHLHQRLVDRRVLVYTDMWLFRKRRRERDAQAATRLSEVRGKCASSPHVTLVHVLDVYQQARHGTKAVVLHDGGGPPQDAWFDHRWPSAGTSHVVLRGAAWGPHNQNPDVLYVHGVYESLPAGTLRAAERHQRRVARDPARAQPAGGGDGGPPSGPGPPPRQ